MNRRTAIAKAGPGFLLAIVAMTSARAQHNDATGATEAKPAVTYYVYCESQAKTPTPVYMSAVAPRIAGVYDQKLKQSFLGFLKKKYGYAGPAYCTSYPNQAWLEDYRKKRVDELRSRKDDVVETDWAYHAPATIPPPSSQPPAH